jgi:hypothetical protein
MNIDTLSRLVESADVSTLRTLSAVLLPLIGLNSLDFCDGPYDGGKDFTVSENIMKSTRIAVQLSIEKDWRKKMKIDVVKAKRRFGINVLYFISSRRIPESSFEEIRDLLLIEEGVSVIKYDCQAIASRFIKSNKVEVILSVFDVSNNFLPSSVEKYLGPRNEAISALLLFDADAKDYRTHLYDSIVKSVLARQEIRSTREDLIRAVLACYNLTENQYLLINSSVDRLVQKADIIINDGFVELAEDEKKAFFGIIAKSKYEAKVLGSEVSEYLDSVGAEIDDETKTVLIENLLELTLELVGHNLIVEGAYNGENEAYSIITHLLHSKIGEERTRSILLGLTEVVSRSAFTRNIASAKLFELFINSNSARLIGALGGKDSLNVFIDSSVAIPIVCGILFDATKNRFSRSAATLFKLIQGHRFGAIIPDVYVEEMAAHLVEACRDYRFILGEGEELSYSGNAFVSHYSAYVRTSQGKGLTFADYVRVFGVKLSNVSVDISDSEFFLVRDSVIRELNIVMGKYGIAVQRIEPKSIKFQKERINEVMLEKKLTKPSLLIEHDAKVVRCLSEYEMSTECVKLLCTWDKMHMYLNPDGQAGYYVMTPVTLIDYLSVAKNESADCPVSQLVDFALMQSDSDVTLSSKIWDTIASIERGNLSDGRLMLLAREFKEAFLIRHNNDITLNADSVEKAWRVWKKTRQM